MLNPHEIEIETFIAGCDETHDLLIAELRNLAREGVLHTPAGRQRLVNLLLISQLRLAKVTSDLASQIAGVKL